MSASIEKKQSVSDNANSARERLLEVAGTLFARHGLDGLSVRRITAEAEVNLAAINYHFGSKDGLFHAVCLRKIQVSNRERNGLLDSLEKKGNPTIEEILEAFVRPAVMFLSKPDSANLLMSRIIMDEVQNPSSPAGKLFRDEIRPITERFVEVLKRALPSAPAESVMWGLVFHTGVMLHMTTCAGNFSLMYPAVNLAETPEELIGKMVKYSSAGLRALA